MNLFKQFNSAFTSNLSMFVVLTALLALMFPSFFTPLSGYVSVLLQIIMFTMGLTLKASDFSHVLKNPTSVIMVSAIQYLFMPLSAFAIAKLFGLSGDVALGLIIVGSVPGGTASNIMALLANGNVPLSVSATTVSTLLSPFVTPLLIATYGGAFIEIAFWPMFLSITQIVLVPIVLGLVVSHLLGDKSEKIKTAMPSFSSMAVLLVLAGTVSVNRENLLTGGLTVVLAVLVHHLLAYAIVYFIYGLFNASAITKRTCAIEVAAQNTGLSASLGLTHFSPEAALAGAAGTIVHTLVGMMFGSLCAKKDTKEAEGGKATVRASRARATALQRPN
ncbi:MAG TPA: sodium symporter [Aerococcaceae bacterium]|nr:sodium symporter [Aerococcaceae bacterium]